MKINIGILEKHGSNLPLGTDIFGSRKLQYQVYPHTANPLKTRQ